jgi:hypothetical protein
MSTGIGILTLCSEFTSALTEVLAENAVGPARRGRLARARAAVKKHPEYSEHAYSLAVETAFTQWEAMQNVGALGPALSVGATLPPSKVKRAHALTHQTVPRFPPTVPSRKAKR